MKRDYKGFCENMFGERLESIMDLHGFPAIDKEEKSLFVATPEEAFSIYSDYHGYNSSKLTITKDVRENLPEYRKGIYYWVDVLKKCMVAEDISINKKFNSLYKMKRLLWHTGLVDWHMKSKTDASAGGRFVCNPEAIKRGYCVRGNHVGFDDGKNIYQSATMSHKVCIPDDKLDGFIQAIIAIATEDEKCNPALFDVASHGAQSKTWYNIERSEW